MRRRRRRMSRPLFNGTSIEVLLVWAPHKMMTSESEERRIIFMVLIKKKCHLLDLSDFISNKWRRRRRRWWLDLNKSPKSDDHFGFTLLLLLLFCSVLCHHDEAGLFVQLSTWQVHASGKHLMITSFYSEFAVFPHAQLRALSLSDLYGDAPVMNVIHSFI